MRTYDIPTRSHAVTIWTVLTLLKLPIFLYVFGHINALDPDSQAVRWSAVAGVALYELLWLVMCAVGMAKSREVA
jgi:hypothetical protein